MCRGGGLLPSHQQVASPVRVLTSPSTRWSRGKALQVARSALTSAMVPSWSLL